MPTEELLTEEEISALLPETPVDEAAAERSRRGRVVPYNFRRPDRLSKEHVRALYMLHDQFANNLTSSLPLFLRTVSEVTLISVEQQSYSDYLRGLSDPTTIYTLSVAPLRGVFVIEFSSSIAFPTIDRLLGGNGVGPGEPRPATELELKVMEGFVSVVLAGYRDVWKPHAEFAPEIVGRETRPQMLQVVPPNEVVATVSYQIQIGDAKGSMSLCLPVALLEPVAESFGGSAYPANEGASPEATATLLRAVSEVRFPVSCDLEPLHVAVADLNSLAIGDVIRTHHSVDRALNVCIADSAKFAGRLAAVDGKLVVQIANANENASSRGSI